MAFIQLLRTNKLRNVYQKISSVFPNIVDSTVENLKYTNNLSLKDVFFALSHGVGTGKLRKKNTAKEKMILG